MTQEELEVEVGRIETIGRRIAGLNVGELLVLGVILAEHWIRSC